jgi:hypothetical protein
VEGFCEHGNEISGSTKFGEFLEQLHNRRLLKKDSAPFSYLVMNFSFNEDVFFSFLTCIPYAFYKAIPKSVLANIDVIITFRISFLYSLFSRFLGSLT